MESFLHPSDRITTTTRQERFQLEQIRLLTEIRDLLKPQKNSGGRPKKVKEEYTHVNESERSSG
jgi:hypothetical protein